MSELPASERSLRFCMITTFYPPYNFGGDGIFVQRLAEALVARGHRVTIIHCIDAYRLGGGKEPTAPVVHEPNIEVHALESGGGILSPLVTHQLAVPGFKSRAIRRILEDNTFDVIHFHNISLVGGPGILAYGNAVKLYTAHEYWLVCPLSTLWQMQRQPCTAKRCFRCMVDAGKPPQWWRYTSWLQHNLEHVDALIAPSQFTIRKHHEMGLDADFTHIPNFLPRADTVPPEDASPVSEKNERPYFLAIGRLEQSKGFQRAINVFREFTDADLLIVGSGQYETQLHEMASGLEHIRLLGKLPYAQLISLYRNAVAVIVPSIWFEPFGLIVLEAFAQHTPVIVNNAGALPELIADSGGGIVYDDDAGLQQAVETLLHSPQQRNSLGQKGHAAYLAKWTEETHLKQYFALIDNVSKRRQQTSVTS
ncbi:MAG: glycosyltransferase family 4 protein [Halioglobus sp.]